jgi:hypothetical protein
MLAFQPNASDVDFGSLNGPFRAVSRRQEEVASSDSPRRFFASIESGSDFRRVTIRRLDARCCACVKQLCRLIFTPEVSERKIESKDEYAARSFSLGWCFLNNDLVARGVFPRNCDMRREAARP